MIEKEFVIRTAEVSAIVRTLDSYAHFKEFDLTFLGSRGWRFQVKHENGFRVVHGFNFVYVEKTEDGNFLIKVSGAKYEGRTKEKKLKTTDDVICYLANELFDAVRMDRRRGKK